LVGRLIVAVATSAFSAMKSAVSTGARAVVSEIGKIPGQAVTALGDVGSKLSHVGAELVGGIASGIRGAAGAVASAIHSIGFHFGGKSISVFGKTITLVPAFDLHLAGGGITNGLTRAVLCDNPGGREAVVPLQARNVRGFNQFLAGFGGQHATPAAQPIIFTGPIYGSDPVHFTREVNRLLTTGQRNGAQITFKAA